MIILLRKLLIPQKAVYSPQNIDVKGDFPGLIARNQNDSSLGSVSITFIDSFLTHKSNHRLSL